VNDTVVFHLKRFWEGKDLWWEITRRRKTSEWRTFSTHWQERLLLCENLKALSNEPIDCTKDLKVHKAWFVVGYPKNNLPRIEADIIGLTYHPAPAQFEIKIANAKEITKTP
jgi:hypothetical protein